MIAGWRKGRLAGAGLAAGLVAGLAAALVAAVSWRAGAPRDPVLAGDGPSVVVMDFGAGFGLDPLPSGWHHRTFWTRPKMVLSLGEIGGRAALSCATSGSASILTRWTDIDLGRFPRLSWSWRVERPVTAEAAEDSRAGDDHPVRFFLRFADPDGGQHAAEIIWANRDHARGDWLMIEGFTHFVADGGPQAPLGVWREESADLAAIYARVTGRASGRGDAGRLTQIGIMCDSDDTGVQTLAHVGGPVTLGP